MSVSSARTTNFDPRPALLRRWLASARLIRMLRVAIGVALLVLLTADLAEAQSIRQGISAFNRQDYVSASRTFIPLAEQGVPAAQSYLGFMFETGRGVPQNYTEAAMWYRRAAEQGDSLAQYSLGLLYDKGFGVPRDIVEASKWLWPSSCWRPSPLSVVRPAVAPRRKPRVRRSAAAQIRSPTRWKPNIE